MSVLMLWTPVVGAITCPAGYPQLRGYVIAGNASARMPLTIEISQRFGGTVQSQFAVGNGRFVFENLRQEPYRVTAKAAGYYDAFTDIDLHGTCTDMVMLELTPFAKHPLYPDTKEVPEEPEANVQTGSGGAGGLVIRDELNQGLTLLSEAKNPEASIPHFEKVIEAAPGYAPAYVLKGAALMDLERWAEAQTVFEKAIELRPNVASAFESLSECLVHQGKLAEGEKPLVQALALEPSNFRMHLRRVKLYLDLNRIAEAEVQARAAQELMPQLPAIHVLLGNVLLRKQDATGALREYETYLKLEPAGEMAASTQVVIERIGADIDQVIKGDTQQLVINAIGNTVRDKQWLHNLVFQQKVTTKMRERNLATEGKLRSANPQFHAVEVIETVVAEGKIYMRRIELNGKPVRESQRHIGMEARTGTPPDFFSATLLGPEMPLESLLESFKITARHDHPESSRIVVDLKSDKNARNYRNTRVELEIDTREMRIVTASYTRTGTKNFATLYVDCHFGRVRGYWLPTSLSALGYDIGGVTLLDAKNEVTYKQFTASSRVVK